MNRSRIRLRLALLAVAFAAVACATPSPSPAGPASVGPAEASGSTPPAGSPAAAGPLPVVVTTDMGVDDLLALFILLRDPAVDVRAITVDGTGLVHCGPGLRNVRRLLVAFDRADIPFGCGRDDPGPDGTPFPDDWRAASDNMYGVVLPAVVGHAFPPEGAALLADTVRSSAEPVTIVALGPWTTLQDLFAAEPELARRIAGIYAMAGAVDVPGNMEVAGITPADVIEWNVGADPDSFRDVLALDIPVTLVPLDATDDVPVPADILARLDQDHAAAGADITYETYARTPYLAGEGQFWWDVAAAVALSQPDLLQWEDATLAISDRGRLSRDPGGRPVRFATGADSARTQDAILAGLRRGAPRPVPFTVAGTVRVTWDGTSCALDSSAAPAAAGMSRVELVNDTDAPVGLVGAGVTAPMTWPDLVAWATSVDLSAGELDPPPGIVELGGAGPSLATRGEAMQLVELPEGTVGFMCALGVWPDLTFVDAGPIQLGD